MGFWSSITKGIKNIGKTVVNSFSSTSGLVTGGLGKGYLDNLGDTISGGLSDAWGDYTGKNIAQKNLDFQKKQFEYQKMLNDKQMQREDTAYQRKVADMTKAGFNPILAAGGAGEASAPLKAAPAPQLPDYSGGVRQGVSDISSLVMKALQMRKDFAQQDAQINLLKSQKDDVNAGIALKNAETAKANAEAERIANENKYGDEYFRLRNEAMRLQNTSRDLANRFDSATLSDRIEKVSVELSLDKVKVYNAQLDSEIKRLGITKAQIDNELSKLDLKYKGNLYRAELAAKTVAVMKSVAEYNTYLWDVSFYHERYNLPYGFDLKQGPFGTTFPQIAAAAEQVKTKITDFLGGHSDDVDNLIRSIVDFGFSTLDAVEATAKKVGVSKNELISSFRRPADGVRRNQYSVMFR